MCYAFLYKHVLSCVLKEFQLERVSEACSTLVAQRRQICTITKIFNFVRGTANKGK